MTKQELQFKLGQKIISYLIINTHQLFYNLTGKEKVKITFNANTRENKTFLTVIENFTPSTNLLGEYDIKNLGNAMTLSGPQASIPNYKGRTIVLQLSK